jgi:hypothetical protein
LCNAAEPFFIIDTFFGDFETLIMPGKYALPSGRLVIAKYDDVVYLELEL